MKQNKFIDQIDHQFGFIADWSVKNRLLVVITSLALLILGSIYMTKVRFDGSLEGWFDDSDRTYNLYKEYLKDFLSDEVTYILYRVPNTEHGPFDYDAMVTIADLTRTFENEVPFVREATSLANVEFMYSEGDTLIVEELLLDFPADQAALLEAKRALMSKPLYINYLINNTGDWAAIYLEMDRASPDPIEMLIHDPEKGEALDNLYPQASDIKVREILARTEFADAGIEFYLSGDVPMNATYNTLYMSNSAIISLITLAIVAAISFLLLRTSLVGLLGPLAVVSLSVVMMLGVIGVLGWTVGLFITMAPSLICAIGVAQAVHILLEYNRNYASTGDKSLSVRKAIRKVGGPCMLAALTTAAGFSVMYFSELQGLAEFGVYAAIGVIFAFLLSVSLLVVVLAGSNKNNNASTQSLTEIEDKDELQGINPLVSKIVEGSISLNSSFPKTILIVFGAMFVWASIGVSKLNVDFNFLDEFKSHVEWKAHTLLADDVMGGILSLVYVIDTETTDGVKDISVIKAIDKLQQFVEQMPEVKDAVSIGDVLKDLNRNFNNDSQDFYKIPDDQNLSSQYLLVYELSGGEELYELVTLDFSKTTLELRVIMTNASVMQDIVKRIDNFLQANPIPNAKVEPTGIGYLWIKIAEYISNTQIISYSLIFVMILIVMSVAYGSLKVGLLSMIPNILPVYITLGAMGWMGINLDYMKLMLATIAIGIAIDDTIHLVTRFRSRFYELENYAEAMSAALKDVGPALVTTTIILIGGFSAYLFTDLAVLASFGVLLGATIGLALIADLLLMPVIFETIKPFGSERLANSKFTENM